MPVKIKWICLYEDTEKKNFQLLVAYVTISLVERSLENQKVM